MLQSPIPEFRKGKRRISSDKHGRVCGRKSERWHCQGFNESRKSNGSKRTGVRKTISPFVHSAKQQTESQQDEQAEHTESIHRNAPNPHRPNTLTTDDHSIWNLVLDACIASARLLLSTPVSVGIPPTSNFRRTTGPLTRMCSNHTSHHPPPAVLETLSIGRGPLALKSNRNSAAIQSPTLYFCATTSHRVRTQSSALVSASARRGGAPPLAHLAGFVISA